LTPPVSGMWSVNSCHGPLNFSVPLLRY